MAPKLFTIVRLLLLSNVEMPLWKGVGTIIPFVVQVVKSTFVCIVFLLHVSVSFLCTYKMKKAHGYSILFPGLLKICCWSSLYNFLQLIFERIMWKYLEDTHWCTLLTGSYFFFKKIFTSYFLYVFKTQYILLQETGCKSFAVHLL